MNEHRIGETDDTLLRQNDLLDEWLGESRYAAQLICQIDDALALLAAKRTTLEEKIIKRELHRIVVQYARLLTKLHPILGDEKQPNTEVLEQLRTLNFRVHAVISELVKALKYNLNYVEQYFEFNFCAQLVDEHRFADELEIVISAL